MAVERKPRRGRPPRLSRERIVEAALDLVDRAGIQGLTMRALARELDADPMAVYRHVRDKDDLLGAMCDRLLVALDPIDLGRGWEPQLRRLAEQVRERFIARPALLPALAAAPVTPRSLLVAADAVGLLVRAGASPSDAAIGVNAVFSFVLGHAVIEAAVPPPSDREVLRDAALADLGSADPPPHLDAAIDLMSDAGDFEAGLDLVLGGLRTRLGREGSAA
jgi:TetR/AcrR family transcriptional regulator, tetracycline repressor protein